MCQLSCISYNVILVMCVIQQGHTNSKVSSLFAGTQDKCVACKKTVYPLEKVQISPLCLLNNDHITKDLHLCVNWLEICADELFLS